LLQLYVDRGIPGRRCVMRGSYIGTRLCQLNNWSDRSLDDLIPHDSEVTSLLKLPPSDEGRSTLGSTTRNIILLRGLYDDYIADDSST